MSSTFDYHVTGMTCGHVTSDARLTDDQVCAALDEAGSYRLASLGIVAS